MDTKELIEIHKTLFETWRFQVNSHWQRSSFLSAFETVALAACWELFHQFNAGLGIGLVLLGIALTLVWILINNRSHLYARYWLEAVGEIEAKLQKRSDESGIDFARKILDDKCTTVPPSKISHHSLELAVPFLFMIAWTILLVFGVNELVAKGMSTMHVSMSYNFFSLLIAIASLLASTAAALIAKSSLSQARQVAERDHKDWRQRKWFDLYFKADEAYDALDRFQALYPNPTSPEWNSPEMQRESHNLMRAMRTVHRIAVVFPKSPAIDALFDATAAFKDMDEAASKERLSKILDAVEGIRQKALIVDLSVLE